MSKDEETEGRRAWGEGDRRGGKGPSKAHTEAAPGRGRHYIVMIAA